MKSEPPPQSTRLTILLIYAVILYAVNVCTAGRWIPTLSPDEAWMIPGLLMLLVVGLLQEPGFTRPVDAFVSSLTALVSVVPYTPPLEGIDPALFGALKGALCVLVLFILADAATAMLLNRATDPTVTIQRVSASATRIAQEFGRPRIVFGAVFFYLATMYHFEAVGRMVFILFVGFLIVVVEPIERAVSLANRLRTIWTQAQTTTVEGHVVGYENPAIAVCRTKKLLSIDGAPLVVCEPNSTSVGIAVRSYMSSDVPWAKLLLSRDASTVPEEYRAQRGSHGDGLILKAHPLSIDGGATNCSLLNDFGNLLGMTCEDTTNDLLRFELVHPERGLLEGAVVQVIIDKQPICYQVIRGITKSEALQGKNRAGEIVATARKLGAWDPQQRGFRSVPWLPEICTPVFGQTAIHPAFDPVSIGRVPGTEYGIGLNTTPLVTHNAAILGILGIGKSCLAYELIRRVARDGVHIICMDITTQYAAELGAQECDHAGINARLEDYRDVIEKDPPYGGGSEGQFKQELDADLRAFLDTPTPAVRVYNPQMFNVTRQLRVGYDHFIEPLTPVQVTRILVEKLLEQLQDIITPTARVWLILEEAHSLIPEWNSTSFQGDQQATNATAKAILQGRKYGLGCLVITQRTANVIKSVLNQCNTIFAMRTFDHTGMEFLRNYLGDDYTDVLSTLDDRHMVVFGRGVTTTNPAIVRVNEKGDFEDWWNTLRIDLNPQARPEDPAAPMP